MSANPYKEEMQACKWIDRALMKDLKNLKDGMHINEVILQVKLLFPVSKLFVTTWIKESYVDMGLIIEEGKILYSKKEVKK